MAKRTREELAAEWESLVDSLKPTDVELADLLDEILLLVSVEDSRNIHEAARRLREPEGIVSYPDDITTRWLNHIHTAKHSARAKGEESPIHNLTSVESILRWWEEEIRPALLRDPEEPENS